MTATRSKHGIEEARRIAREQFGYEQLKPGQEEAITSILERSDALAIMPTGGGKSAIYQIASKLLPRRSLSSSTGPRTSGPISSLPGAGR